MPRTTSPHPLRFKPNKYVAHQLTMLTRGAQQPRIHSPTRRQCLSIRRESATLSFTCAQAGAVRAIFAKSPLTPSTRPPTCDAPTLTNNCSPAVNFWTWSWREGFEQDQEQYGKYPLTFASFLSVVFTPSNLRSKKTVRQGICGFQRTTSSDHQRYVLDSQLISNST